MRILSTLIYAVSMCVLSATAVAQTPISADFRSGFGAFGMLIDGVVPALRGFDVGYTNGDHQIRDMHIAPDGSGDYLILLRDSSGVDPIAGSIKLLDVHKLGFQFQASRSDCIGRCQIALPFSVPFGYTFVLLGFDMHYSTRDGDLDTNIREISVAPFPHNAYVEVYFGDTAGLDAYYAQVDFALIPTSSFRFAERHVSTSVPIQGSQTVRRTRGLALLQAFNFRFTESDHFLRRFRIDLTRNRVRVSFYDRDINDPYVWSLKYAVLD